MTNKIDPKQIFVHADGFYKAEGILSNIDMNKNPQLALEISQAAMVLSALNSELFLKCLICLEKGEVPRGHFLETLFSQLKPGTQERIKHIWDNELVPHRNLMWTKIEGQLGKKIARDLPTALVRGSRAFEKIRYSYEDENEEMEFYLSDLPRILGRVIIEMKPEWANLQRKVTEV